MSDVSGIVVAYLNSRPRAGLGQRTVKRLIILLLHGFISLQGTWRDFNHSHFSASCENIA